MVSVGVSVLGVTGLHFVNPGVKVNGQYYRDTLLKEELLPDMRDISEFFIFQQDNAPAHRAHATVDLQSPSFDWNTSFHSANTLAAQQSGFESGGL